MRYLIWAAVFTLFSLSAFADFTAADWRFSKPIEQAAGGMEKLGAFPVDAEVYRSAQADLSDLRVITARGEEIPYQVVDVWRSEATEQVSAAILNNSFVPGKEQSLILDFGAREGAHNQATLDVSAVDRNFRKMVTVSGSDTLGGWRTLSASNVIYDYSVDVYARKTSLHYPLTTFRYLLIQIVNEGAQQLTITGARATFVKTTGTEKFAEEVRYEGALQVREDPDNRATEAIIDMGQQNIPVHKLIVKTPSKDFHRQVKVYARSDEHSVWKPSVTDVLFHYSDPLFGSEHLAMRTPEMRERFIKVVVVNNDDRPIEVSGIELYGAARTVVFPFTAGEQFALYYGNTAARAPQYDLGYIISRMKLEEHIIQMGLGSEAPNAYYQEPQKPLPPFTERYPYVLNGALILLVVIVGALAIRVLIRNQARQ